MSKIFSVILSFVILITSMGFTVSSHICGGKKVKTVLSVGAADVSCGMEKNENNCATKKQMKPNCCHALRCLRSKVARLYPAMVMARLRN